MCTQISGQINYVIFITILIKTIICYDFDTSKTSNDSSDYSSYISTDEKQDKQGDINSQDYYDFESEPSTKLEKSHSAKIMQNSSSSVSIELTRNNNINKLNRGEINLLIENSIITFATRIFNKISNGKSGNIITSPFSVELSLTLLYCGANGKTAQTLENILGISYNFKNQVVNHYRELLKPLQNSTSIHIATGIFLMNGYHINQSFKMEAKNDFYADIKLINFDQNRQATTIINNWVVQKTDNKIQNFIAPTDLNDSTRLILVNAIYFKGSWKYQFDKHRTNNVQFIISKNEYKNVKMMHQTVKLKYGKIEKLKSVAVELPYANADISMIVILPIHIDGLEDLQNAFEAFDFNLLEKYLEYKNVILSLPKFTTECTMNLNKPLKELGLKEIFTSSANFNRILENSNIHPAELYVSDILQKAFIEVNEQGATATAATGIKITKRQARPMPSPMHVVFNANHPFFYVLKTPSEILFIGKYSN